MSFALFTGCSIIALTLVMWVYFDAIERGKAAIPWALSIVFLGWLFAAPLILYFIFRDTGQRPVVPPGGARRQALYVVSFAGLGTLAIGLSMLVTATIVRVISEDTISRDDYGDLLAGAIAAIIVGIIAWAPLWIQTEPRLSRMDRDEEFRATFYLHRSYVYTVIGAGLVVTFLTGLWLLGGGLSDAFGSEDIGLNSWLPALGPLSVALLGVGYHYLVALDRSGYRLMLARFESIPAPPVVGGPVVETAAVQIPAPSALASPPAPPARRPAGLAVGRGVGNRGSWGLSRKVGDRSV